MAVHSQGSCGSLILIMCVLGCRGDPPVRGDKGACSGYTNGDQVADLISVVPN